MIKKVLVVDDNSDERKILKTLLERQSFEVVEARDGLEGLEKARLDIPDIIISDALMPRMDGFQFLREVKKEQRLKPVPFIFYSAVYTGYKEAQLAQFLGATAFIARPKEPQEFWKELSRALEDNNSASANSIAAMKLLEEDEVFLEKYSKIVVAKLVETVAELRKTLADLRGSRKALEESEERFLKIASTALDAVILMDDEGNVSFWNDAATMMFGYTREEVEGKDLHSFIMPERYRSAFTRGFESFQRTGKGPFVGKVYEMDAERKGGTEFPVEIALAPLELKGKWNAIGIVRDITERKKLEEEIRHMGNHDLLTGLPNPRLFRELIELELAQAERNGKKAAIFFLDLDRFKEINDALGHRAGDILLKEAGQRLKNHVRKSDTVARIGADEFNVIVTDITRAEDSAEVARNIVHAFRSPFVIGGHELNSTASIGISIYPDDSTDADTLLRYADIALHHAKHVGKNNYRFYESSIYVMSLERMRLASMLQRSIDSGEMVVYYQPLVDIRSRRIVCAETLARWHHPERGLLEPKDFIPAAEEIGFISAIDDWSLKSACRQVRAWLDAGTPPVCLTVNLSARQFQDPGLVSKISAIVKESGIPPGYLDLEITESIAMADVEQSVARLKELSAMGIHFSVDDFGTGYSSLNYLKKLPIERLKIDKSFIQDIPADPDDKTIVEAVIAMAHNMKMKVVAEGVETEEQLEFLKNTGCDEMQGFLFSEPLPADKFKELITAGK